MNTSSVISQNIADVQLWQRRVGLTQYDMKILVKHVAAPLKNAHFVSFLKAIWSVAGHAKGFRGQSAREKSKLSPNPRVGLLQLSRVRSV
jgi:hypothetical protein